MTLYEFKKDLTLSVLSTAPTGLFTHGDLVLKDVSETRLDENAAEALADARPPKNPPATVVKVPERTVDTTLSAERLLARVLTPERMSIVTLLDYVDYLRNNQLQYGRQVVALWRKLAYPFTLLVMITIAAIGSARRPRRRAGARASCSAWRFFMLNQLALNVGMLGKWRLADGAGPEPGRRDPLALGAMSYGIPPHHHPHRPATLALE